MVETKTVYISVVKKEQMGQDAWVKMMQRITAVLCVHTSSPHLRHWVSAADAQQVSACWEVLVDVDQQRCVQSLLGRLIEVFESNAARWASADVTYVKSDIFKEE